MSGFIGEIPKKITRGWLEILDKDNIEMIDTKIEYEDSYEIIENIYNGDMPWTNNNFYIKNSSTADEYRIGYYTYLTFLDGSKFLKIASDFDSSVFEEEFGISELFFKFNNEDIYHKMEEGGEFTYPGDTDAPIIGTNSNIYKKVKVPHEVEYIHPHFGTKRKSIKKAWVGNINNEPELALYSEDYHVYNRPLLPYDFIRGLAVVYHNRIHILGGGNSYPDYLNHYSYDGNNWIKEQDLPTSFVSLSGGAVVYNDRIYMTGFDNAYDKMYYWDGTNYGYVQTPVDLFGPMVLYHDKIHILGPGTNHYSYDGISFVKETSLPININYGKSFAVVCEDRIFLFANGDSSKTKIYSYNYDTKKWINELTLDVSISYGSAVVCKDESITPSWTKDVIHIFGGEDNQSAHYIIYVDLNPTLYIEQLNDIPYFSFYGGNSIIYENEIYLLGSYTYSPLIFGYLLYKYNINNRLWTQIFDMPYHFYNGDALIYNDEIYIFGGGGSSSGEIKQNRFAILHDDVWEGKYGLPNGEPFEFKMVFYNDTFHFLGGGQSNSDGTRHYSYDFDLDIWVSESILPYKFINGSAVVYHDEIHILGPGTNHYSYDGSSWIKETDLNEDYGVKLHSCVIFNDKIYLLGGTDLNSNYPSKGTYWDEDNDRWVPFDMPYCIIAGAAVVYHNKIHIFGGSYGNTGRNHYSYDGNKWMKEFDLPYNFSHGSAVVYDDEIYLLGGQNSQYARLVTNLNHYFS